VENPCNGAQNCRVSSGRARDLLQILLENNTKILDLYRNTVT
jgi:hypothetical protein